MKLAIIITKPPYGDVKTVEALSYANTAVEVEMKVDLILVDGGVLLAKKGQVPDIAEYTGPYEALKNVIHLGGTVIADKGSLKEFDLDAGELIDDVQVVHGYEISMQVKEADKAMIF